MISAIRLRKRKSDFQNLGNIEVQRRLWIACFQHLARGLAVIREPEVLPLLYEKE